MATRRLPAAPDLDHLKNQAKRLLAAYRAGEPDAVADFRSLHPDVPDAADAQLTDAQLVLARSYRHASFPRLLTTARVQRALHDNDVAALQCIVADDPDALRAYSTRLDGSGARGFGASRRVTQKNVRAFLRAHAPELPVDDLELLTHGPHGGEIRFRYGADRIVKVPKNGSRVYQLKEAQIINYLRSQQSLPIAVPEPLFIHEQGYYAVFRVGEGKALTPDTLASLNDADLETAIASMVRFFHALHTHDFPEHVLAHVPRADDGYDVAPDRARRKIEFIAEHSDDYDTEAWLAQIDRLEPSLNQRWALAQCDPQTTFFTAVDGDWSRLSMGSFCDAHQHDPAIDVHDLILEIEGDIEDPAKVRQIGDLIVEHYPTDDPDLRAKIDFGLLGFRVRRAHMAVRARVRRQERAARGH